MVSKFMRSCIFSLLSLLSLFSLSHARLVFVFPLDLSLASVDSCYTTIGSYPSTGLVTNFTIVRSEKVDKHNLNPHESSAGEIEGRAIVFVGSLPIDVANLAKDAEKFGATALIFKKIDHFKDGRAVAFDTPVDIPIIVVSESDLETIVSYSNRGPMLHIDPPNSSEMSLINRMKHEIDALIIISVVIYCFLVPFFVYLLIFEIMYTYRTDGTIISHSAIMKLNALIMAICWLLWLTVDPLGMRLRENWNGPFTCFLAGGFMLSLYVLILRILLNILFAPRFTSRKTKLWISISLYTLALFFIIICAMFGSVWNNPTTANVFKYFICTSVLVVGIIYAIVGKLMIDTINGSANARTKTLIMRLTGFIAYYGVASVVLLGTVHLHFHNAIYTTFTCAILHSVGLLVTFLLLFLRFPSQMKSSKQLTSSSSSRSLNKNTSFYGQTPSTESNASKESKDRSNTITELASFEVTSPTIGISVNENNTQV